MKDKLKGFFGTSEEPEERTEVEEGFYKTSREEYHEQNGIAGSKMMLLEPRAYSESQQIADYYHVNTSTIKHINTGRNYHDDTSDYPLRKVRGKKQLEPVETILAKRSTATIDT